MHYWSTIWSFDICIPCIIYIRVNIYNSLNTYNFIMVKTLIILSSSFSKYKVNYWLLWSVSYVITAYHNFFPHQPLIRNLLLATVLDCSTLCQLWVTDSVKEDTSSCGWNPLLAQGFGGCDQTNTHSFMSRNSKHPQQKGSSLWMKLFLHWVSVAWLPLKCRPLF